MTLLYRVENEIAIEMSREAWTYIHDVVERSLNLYNTSDAELRCFVNSVRAHIQHLEAEKSSPPPSNNLDLI